MDLKVISRLSEVLFENNDDAINFEFGMVNHIENKDKDAYECFRNISFMKNGKNIMKK